MTVRLGAIYALDRISKDSRRDHWTIMETLTGFVREQAPWPPRQPIGNPFVQLQVGGGGDETKGENTPAEETEKGAEPLGAQIRPPTDIQAVLTVLGRRDERARKLDQAARRRLGLRNTDLRGADLFGAHLQGADLRRAGVLTELTQAQLDSTFGDDH